MINVSSLVEPLGSFPILPYLIQALRAVIREELSEDDVGTLGSSADHVHALAVSRVRCSPLVAAA